MNHEAGGLMFSYLSHCNHKVQCILMGFYATDKHKVGNCKVYEKCKVFIFFANRNQKIGSSC